MLFDAVVLPFIICFTSLRSGHTFCCHIAPSYSARADCCSADVYLVLAKQAK